MAVSWVREKWDGRQGGGNASADVKASKQYLVKTDDKSDSEFDVLTDASLPAFGDPHPVVPQLFVEDIRIAQLAESPYYWNLTVSYTNQRQGENSGQLDGDTPSTSGGGSTGGATPTFLKPEISWATEQFQVVCDTTVEGIRGVKQAICNSAGDPFDPMPMKDESRLICNIKSYFETIPVWILDYQDAINNAAITIDGVAIDEYQAKVQSVAVSEIQRRGDVEFRTVQMRISVLKENWVKKVLDQGFRAFDATADDTFIPYNITDDDGNQISSPVLLDGEGFKLDPPTAVDAVYLDFYIYPEKDFTELPGVS